jgi:hypothetical protein
VNDTGSQHEKPVTPKLGVSFKLNPDNMLYATASKGYRIGGYNPRVGAPCASDPNYGGYHTLFDSDSVWSYELGSKNDLLDDRVRVNTSLYYIDWSNIQQVVGLSSCGFAYTSNLGKAAARAWTCRRTLALTRNFVAGLAIGYNDARSLKPSSPYRPRVSQPDHGRRSHRRLAVDGRRVRAVQIRSLELA